MGRTPKPLKILVHPALAAWPEWEALRAQGHPVTVLVGPQGPQDGNEGPLDGYDVIFGPTCWRMEPGLRGYLDTAIQNVRRGKYPTAKKVAS